MVRQADGPASEFRELCPCNCFWNSCGEGFCPGLLNVDVVAMASNTTFQSFSA